MGRGGAVSLLTQDTKGLGMILVQKTTHTFADNLAAPTNVATIPEGARVLSVSLIAENWPLGPADGFGGNLTRDINCNCGTNTKSDAFGYMQNASELTFGIESRKAFYKDALATHIVLTSNGAQNISGMVIDVLVEYILE